MMKNILVTGSSGKLGKAVVHALRKKGYIAHGIDLIPSETTNSIIDINDKLLIEKLAIPFDAIVHTAAMHGKHYELNYPREEFIHTNIDGTFNLLSNCVAHKIPKFIYISSTSVYGKSMENADEAVWVDEELIPRPRDIYDITKLTAEMLCEDFFDKDHIESTVLRVSRFLPESENIKAINRLYRGLDEEDAAEGIILALNKKFDEFEIFNISNDSVFQKTDLKELINNPKNVILNYFPEAEEVFNRKQWIFPEKIDRVYCIDKAKKVLGYSPKNNFDKFLQ